MNNGRILTTLIVLLLVSTGCATAPLTKDWGFMTAKDREYHRYTKLETFAEKPAHGNSVKFEGEGCAFLWIWRTPENAHKNPGPSPTYVVEITEEKPWVSLPVPESDFGTVIIGVDDFGNPTTTGQRYLWESILKTDDRLSVNGHTCDQIDEAIYQKFFKD